MTVVTAWPRTERVLDPVWNPLPDGCRLAARIWRPADAEADPVPAVPSGAHIWVTNQSSNTVSKR